MEDAEDAALRAQAATVQPYVLRLQALHERHEITDADMVGLYILCWHAVQQRAGGKVWCAGRLPSPIVPRDALLGCGSIALSQVEGLVELLGGEAFLGKRVESAATVTDVFNTLALGGIKGNKGHYINSCMVQWALGSRPVVLRLDIPSPMEVLRMQAGGERVVTVLVSPDELSRRHRAALIYMESMPDHEKDCLAFCLHDLKHMENFCSPETAAEQRGFFRCMLRLPPAGRPREFFRARGLDARLWRQLEYVVSDMNCFTPHLLGYLLAKVVSAVERKHGLLQPQEEAELGGEAEAEAETETEGEREGDEGGAALQPAGSSLGPSHVEVDHVFRVYDNIAVHWNHTRGKRKVHWHRVKAFLEALPAGSVLADVGSGDGKYFGLNPGVACVGCDRSWTLLQVSREPGHETFCCDAVQLPFRSASVDAAICVAVLHHLASPERRVAAISELVRITRPGGRVLIQAWALEQGEASRRVFDGQDVMVPWMLQPRFFQEGQGAGDGESSESSAASTPHVSPEGPCEHVQEQGGSLVFQRYCHVYREGELQALCAQVPGCRVVDAFWDKGNWAVEVEVLAAEAAEAGGGKVRAECGQIWTSVLDAFGCPPGCPARSAADSMLQVAFRERPGLPSLTAEEGEALRQWFASQSQG